MLVVTTFALEGEFAAWRRLRPFRRRIGAVTVYQADLARVQVRVVITGIGYRAAAAASAAVFQDRPDLCIASGFAGGLNRILHAGEVVVPTRVRGLNGYGIASDPSLVALAVGCGATPIGTLHSAPRVVVTSEEKRRMSAIADAVDMESASIAGEARRRDVPCVALRAITDPVTVNLPIDFNRAIDVEGGLSVIRVIGSVAARPKAVPDLVRFGADCRRASAVLAAFLDEYVEHAACHHHRP